MKQILVYADSLSWGIIPLTRNRLPFAQRWPGLMEQELVRLGHDVRVLEDCLNGRRTVFDDPYLPDRNGQQGLATLVRTIRQAPIEPGMPVPPVLVVVPPPIGMPQGLMAAKFQGADVKS